MTEFVFTKATKKKSKLRLAIDGPAGSGKTYTALTAAKTIGGKVALIDTERGSASLYSDEFVFDVLELESFSPQLYINAIEAAEKAGYDVIIIDSLSAAWEGEGGALDMVDQAAKRSQSGNTYVAWKDVTPLQRRLIDTMLQSPTHIIATMRSKMDYVQERDEKTGRTAIRKVGLAPVQRQGMEYEFTLVCDMDVDHNLIVSKSRCKVVADKVVNKPDNKFFQIIIDWLNSGDEITEKPVEKPAPQPTTQTRPYTPEYLKEKFAVNAAQNREKFSEDERGIIAGQMNSMFLGSVTDQTRDRHAVLRYLSGKPSIKELSDGEVYALRKWINMKPVDGKMQPDPVAVKESISILTAVKVQDGQLTII